MTAPTPVYFTVTADYTGFDGGPVNGRGTIAPVFGQGQIAVLSGTPNVGIVPSSVDFRIVNGVMWAANVYGVSSAATAPTQVQLVANSGLNITGDFYYQVTFYELTVDDAPTGMAPFAFTAPTGATTLDLLSVTPVPSPSHPGGQAKGDQGFSFAGLQPVSGGTAVQGLVQSASGPVAVGSAVTLPVGPTGPANSLSIGSVSSVGPNAGSATVGGTAPNQSLSLALPRGYSFAGLTASGDGTHVQGLVETATGTAPIGDAIGISLSYNSTVTHGSNAATARPPVSVSVIWIGSVQPSNAISGDVWLDTSGVAPSISTTSLNPLNAGVPFMQQLNVSAGTQPIVWAVSSGSLPAGLALSSAGVLSGAPSTSGTYTFTVSATNGYGAATQTFSSVSVGAAVAPTITTSTLGTLTVGTPVSVQLTYTGSTPTWSSGTLPNGLSLNYLTGYISGTPTTAASGGYFTVTATNPGGATSQIFPSDVNGSAPVWSTTSITGLWRNFSYTGAAFSASGSPTFAVKSGSSLPPTSGGSMSLSSSGVLTGTPSTTGTYTFTITATNSYGSTDYSFTVWVSESTPAINAASLGSLQVGTSVNVPLSLSAGGPSVTWGVSSGQLPGGSTGGLTLNASTGVISGTPTVAAIGSYSSFSVSATNGNGDSGTPLVFGAGSVAGLSVAFTRGSNVGVCASAITQILNLNSNVGDTVLIGISDFSSVGVSSVSYSGGGTASLLSGSNVGFGGVTAFGQMWVYKLTGFTSGTGTLTVAMNTSTAITFAVNAVSYSNVVSVSNVTSTASYSTLSSQSDTCPAQGALVKFTSVSLTGVVTGVTAGQGTSRQIQNILAVADIVNSTNSAVTGAVITHTTSNIQNAGVMMRLNSS